MVDYRNSPTLRGLPRMSFFSGAARAFDIGGTLRYNPRKRSIQEAVSDSLQRSLEVLAMDYNTVIEVSHGEANQTDDPAATAPTAKQ